MKIKLLLPLVIVLILPSTFGLKCYNVNSGRDDTYQQHVPECCKTSFQRIYQDFPSPLGEYNVCMKVIYNNEKVYLRCASKPVMRIKDLKCEKNGRFEICYCNTDGCNKGETLAISSVGTLLLISLLGFFLY